MTTASAVIEDIYPLTPLQQGLLFHTLLSPESGVYMEQFSCVIKGLDVDAFEWAWNEVIKRHAILRTYFIWEGREGEALQLAEPLQVVVREVTLPIDCKDWRDLSVEQRGDQLHAYQETERQSGFALTRAPLMRLGMMRIGEMSYQVAWSFHHLLLDGWSVSTVLGEVLQAYLARRAGRSPALAPRRAFRDYVGWLAGHDPGASEPFWRRYLAGFDAPTPLEVSPPTAPQLGNNAYLTLLSKELSASLEMFAHSHHLTPSTVVQGAWGLLLSRYSGKSDVVFGSATSGRSAPLHGIEEMVGMLINTLPVRLRTHGDPAVVPWLIDLQEQLALIREYEYSPLPKVHDWSEVPRGVPLFDSLIAFENYPLEAGLKQALGGSGYIDISEVTLVERTNYPLNFIFAPGEQCVVRVEYDQGRMDPGAITRLTDHFRLLLKGIIEKPQSRLSDLDILTEAERHQLVEEWNATGAEYASEQCIHELFEVQVEKNPEATAIVYECEQLSYRELNERANRLAHHLIGLGVGPEVPVAICVERSLEMVVGMLGILKAGGAYVPLDPEYAHERLKLMLQEAPVLLTQEKLVENLPLYRGFIVCLDSESEEIALHPDKNPSNAAMSENLAYVIYTSGTTGIPKGVAIEHGALQNLVSWHHRTYSIEPGDRASLVSSVGFDASVWELWPYLTAGATVLIASDDIRKAPSHLCEWLVSQRVTVTYVPTPLMAELLRREWSEAVGLRTLLTGGERLSTYPSAELGVEVVNHYGPTECTVVATSALVMAASAENQDPPIGRPISNTQIYILDEGMNPVPVGVGGELYIAGAGLARGYLGRPGQTAEKFIANPFSPEAGARMYRTGDLGRYRADGNIEFMGRIDHQVKVRGYRIELGEIESALGQHAGVREAVVVAREDEPGEKRLVGYVVAAEEPAPTVSELRSYLKEKLPEYMVPATFVYLEKLPLTANGKLDRRALPAPGGERPELEQEYVAPRNEVEQALVEIWKEVLGVEQVGVHDNFFELGGHSLLATQVMSRVRNIFAVEPPLRILFDVSTVSGLAKAVEEVLRGEEGRRLPPLVGVSREGEIPLSYAQERLWFLEQLVPGNPFYNLPVGIRVTGQLDIEALEASFNEIVRRHEVLRTRFEMGERGPVQAIAGDLRIVVPVVELSGLGVEEREAEIERRLKEEASKPFDLSEGRLLRVTVLRLGEREHVVMPTMHHVVSDEWSMRVLVQEVAALYEAYTQRRRSPLEELPIQYADYAIWQREWLTGGALEEQLRYWSEKLAGELAAMELPTDRPRPAVQSFRGATLSFELCKGLTESLKELSREQGATLYMTLLAGFKVLLHRYSGQTDIVVGSPIANRNRTETEGLIGFFVNTLALRTDLSGNPTFEELLRRVRETALEAYAHQDLPFEKLVEELNPRRDMSRQPLFQVVLAVQNAPMPVVTFSGLSLEPIPLDNGTSKFDLTLFLTESNEQLYGELEYATDLFDEGTIRRLAEHYKVLLESIVEGPERRLSELQMLGEAERRQVVEEWNATGAEYASEQCIHELFEAQVERSAQATAVVYEGEQLSYRELNERANRVAHHLIELGVGPETRVGICVERSLEMVVGLLGILKAGGAYVPLDPEYPQQRLGFMLADAQVGVLLTQEKLLSELPEHQAHTVCLDRDWEEITKQPAYNPTSGVSADNLAYVIYTSGSTGTPKGVEVVHRNVARLLTATAAWFGFNQEDVWTLFHSYAFDFSVWELWGSLGFGGRLIVVPFSISRSPEQFRELLVSAGVTVLNHTPSAFLQQIPVDESSVGEQKLQLRLVIFGGEALDFESLQPWFARYGDEAPQLVNMYGITETTVHVTYYPVKSTQASRESGSLIGRPIPDLQIYILDEGMNPVPVGVGGELYIAGAGLARGYLGRPGQTAEKFIANPFSPEAGARMYRTGDLGRYRADGNIEFMGRIDHQVKVRGYRIELGEIESALGQHAGVREAVVVAREDEPGEKRLVGYVVAAEEPAPTVSELRSYLKEKLPEYMVPATFVYLEKLPLTANGKLDRRALPAPGGERPELEQEYVAPRNEVEQALVEIWKEVLGVEQVGVHDNFFELGGDSILSIRIAARAQEAGLRISLVDLFQHQTIEQLAEGIDAGAPEVISLLPSEPFSLISAADRSRLPEEIDDAYPLAKLQAGMLFHSELSVKKSSYHDVFSYLLRIEFDGDALANALEEIAIEHPILRTSFDFVSYSEPLQLVRRKAVIPLVVHDLRGLNPEEQLRVGIEWVAKERENPFEWDQAPLLRVHVHRLEDQRASLTLSFHHAILDGWSVATLLTELLTRYLAHLKGSRIPITGLRSCYRDFIALEQGAINSEDNHKYWMALLDDSPRTFLPRFEEQRTHLSSAETILVTLTCEFARRLEESARKSSVPLKTMMLSVHLKVIGHFTGQRQVVTGIVSHGRPETRDGERVFGNFLNSLPMKWRLTDGSWTELFREVYRTEQKHLLYRRYPFAVMQRQAGGEPIFDTLFNLVNFHVLESLSKTPDVELSVLDTYEESNVPLIVNVLHQPRLSGLSLRLSYDPRVLDRELVESIARCYQTALGSIAENPEAQHQDTILLSAAERRQLVEEWNATGAEYASEQCIHELFEVQVEKNPEATAIVYECEQLSYRELNERANRLAHHLIGLGVGPEVPVAICVERSLEMVVGMLGILKAGGAYVPLDPEYPRQRLGFMLGDAQVGVLLTQQRLLSELPDYRAHTVCLDTDWEEIERQPAHNPASAVSSGNLAYIIYTSGSTGVPKGVLGLHRGAINRLGWMWMLIPFAVDDVCCARTSLNFVDSVWELFGPLLAGTSNVIFSAETGADPVKLSEMVALYGITRMVTVPSLLRAIRNSDSGLEKLRSLRCLVSSGEALPRELSLEISKGMPSTTLINLYGSSEVSADVTCWLAPITSRDTSVPIGRPISNTQIYILDEGMNPVPVGVGGELYIAGAGLARGYLGRPGQTAEKFIANPFSPEAGARMYRTGDLGRYRADGNIEFMGRIDHQVKVRGYRIELGEIESALGQHAGVREAVVVAREDEPGEKRLVGYVVAAEEPAPTVSELRSYLKEKLPEYMVPATFVYLEKLPLTANGKLDRRALPAPGGERPELEQEYVAPRNEVEQALVEIWKEVLGVEQVGVHDNFFELGGHSLLATQMVSRLRQLFCVELPLRRLFEAPTVARLSSVVEEVLRGEEGRRLPPLVGVSREGEIPLSYAQERLWFLEQLVPGNPFYNLPVGIRVTGQLDIEALEASFNEIVRRHEVLRTRFEMGERGPVQAIAGDLRIVVPVVELSGLGVEEREAEIERRLKEEASKPFDLSEGRLLRVTVLRLGEREHVVMPTMHHVVSDEWSMRVLVQEVAALYEAYTQRRRSPLEELPIQYADYAIWQREWLTGGALEEQLRYWSEKLAGELAAMELPTDRPRPAVQSFRGATLSFELCKGLTESLKELSREQGATLYMTLLAGFKVLLHRYSGQTDIVVGSPIANRNRTETEGLIGFFVNTLALRTDLSGNPTFEELLRRVRETALEAYAHQDLPFEKLVEELNPRRDMSRQPLFQVVLAVQNAPMPVVTFSGLSLEPIPLDNGTSKFDLTLFLTESNEQLYGELEYATDLFDEGTIRRLAEHYKVLLESIVEGPERRLSELQMLGEAERRQMVEEWNATGAEYASEQCIHELFEAQVERSAQATAVVYEGEQLSYRELNERANRVAHHLIELGVGPETRVGICVERSLEMVVGLLGILKAGGAYVPLDPEYPQQRLGFMLADAQVGVLLTQEKLLSELPEHQAHTVCLDRDWEEITKQPAYNPTSGVSADNLAYVIYTSGSTGTPKGVEVVHRNVARLLTATAAWFGFNQEDVWTLFHSYAFDFSVWELWGSLGFGGRLIVVPFSISRSPEQFRELLVSAGVTVLNHTPSAFLQQIPVDESSVGEQKLQLRLVIFGGEALDFESLQPWFARYGDEAPQLVNMYGITETTVHVTYYPVKSTQASRESGSLIGRPIPDLQIYILDEGMNPVPVGVGGELYIAGAGLARGYLGRPGQTAEKFIANPFSPEAGARMYRTGDLGRYRADGNIEFMGRIDHQVKVRGYRIELGEIESALGQHAGVREAVVVAREDEPGEKRLVGYVVAAEEPAPTVSELRSYLKEKLPEYMVPATFVYLEKLPLTANGKLDRRALPAPGGERPELEQEYVAPRNEVEQALVEIWKEVLGVEQVGVHDNFFELGGHSLLATQVMSRVRNIFAVEPPLRILFDVSTVSGLAKAVEEVLRGEEGRRLPPLVGVSREGEIPLSYAQERLWFLEQLVPGNPFYNLPVGIRVTGQLDIEALEASFNEIVRRHEVLRTRFEMGERGPVQAIAGDLRIVVPVVELSGLGVEEREAEIERRLKEEASKPFDLSEGRLLRVTVLRLGEREHVVMPTMHHVVSDEWSMRVLVQEVAALYEAYTQRRRSPLEELPIQYADYAIWQREWLTGGALEEQLRYWSEKLAGELAAMELPTDRPRPAVQSFRGATLSFELCKGLTESLKELSREQGATLYMTLLAGFKVLLHRYSGQTDIVVGSPIANRNRTETEGLIGFFVNTLALRTDLSGNPTFEELLRRVRETALEAYAHQDLPFEKLVEELNPRRDMSRQPLFQVVLAVQNAPMPVVTFSGLSLEPIPLDNGTSKFDLTLFLTESNEQLYGELEYATDLFDEGTIRRLAEHYKVLLESIVEDPERRLSELRMLGEAERRQVVEEWNATGAEYASEQCIHELFEAQVEQSAAATAVVYEGEQLSYAELNERANRLAHHLIGLGVGPETRVGICVERSLEMVVGLLGILKAGGAYVPLDPEYPQQRLGFMLADAQVGVLLTQEKLLSELPEHQAHTVCLDRDWEEITKQPAYNPTSGVSADNLAYVIYTSGSTGTPKGVEVVHQAVVNFLYHMRKEPGLNSADTLLATTGISFDIAALELLLTLTEGARLMVVSRETVMDGPELIRTITECGATIMQATPATWRMLTGADWKGNPGMKVLCGGEAITRTLGNQLLVRSSAAWNMYGPAETTIWSAVHRIEWSEDEEIPIGRPISNTQMYILDQDFNPVPIGVTGDLYIGGAGLARGYMRRPGQTADRFIANPFSQRTSGSRIYRTGDLARYRDDGNIEFLGRSDSQVKIRGHRIELGEIESALLQHPAVKEAVVVAREDGDGDKRLVAYMVGRPGAVTEKSSRAIEFGLFFFAASRSDGAGDRYQLYLEAAKFADRHGLKAIWTPERHFTEVGAPYPSPSVLSAALAMVTERVELRSGSIVLPLNNPLRVAEDWSVVDNLSNGRVALSFASGWVPQDFVLAPDHYRERQRVMLEGIEQVRRLWRGEAITMRDGMGGQVPIRILPRPVQTELPIWLTAAGSPSTFEAAGAMGANVLTALLNQTPEQLAQNIRLYRRTLEGHGYDPTTRTVTVMLHTFVSDSDEAAQAVSRAPLRSYLEAHTELQKNALKAWEARLEVTPEDVQAAVDRAVDRFLHSAALIGSPPTCLRLLKKLREIGVGEIACLVDFGIESDVVLGNLAFLDELATLEANHLDTTSVRSLLRARLPEHMVPASLIVLDEMPLTPNSKIDRRALPEPDSERPTLERAYVAPSNEIEEVLCEIWAELLGIERIGIEDDFFELGGHSLLATRVVVRVRASFDVVVPLRTLFEESTVRALAREIELAIVADTSATALESLLDRSERVDSP